MAVIDNNIQFIEYKGEIYKKILKQNSIITTNTDELKPGSVIKKFGGGTQIFIGQFYSSCFKNQYEADDIFYGDNRGNYSALLDEVRNLEKDVRSSKINLMINVNSWGEKDYQKIVNNTLSSQMWNVSLIKKPSYMEIIQTVDLPENFSELIIESFKKRVNEVPSYINGPDTSIAILRNYIDSYNYLTISKDKAKKCYIDDFIAFR